MERYIDRIIAIVVVAIIAAAMLPVAIQSISNASFSDTTIQSIWSVLPIIIVVAVLLMFVKSLKE
ncbi:MAG: hypothetical protein ACXQS5_03910 [Candidatus Methanospirareceae archaeon]